jgi:hypothetical protein
LEYCKITRRSIDPALDRKVHYAFVAIIVVGYPTCEQAWGA